MLHTIKTILLSEHVEKFRIIIQADRTPIEADIKQELLDLGVEIYWNDEVGSQFKKLKQIVTKTHSDIFIFTQDDITFRPDTIVEIVKEFAADEQVSMVGSRVLPLSPVNWFEAAMTSMVRIVDRTAGNWNNGTNYLAASGRCLSFRTSYLKKFRFQENVVNGDMYLYLENKRLGGRFKRSHQSIIYLRCPQSLKDQLGPSSRFQYSQSELTGYFDTNISSEYEIPMAALLKASIFEFLCHPVNFVMYITIFFYSRLKKQPISMVTNPLWNIDISTKGI